MPKPEDRVTIKLGPSRYDTPRAIRAKVQEVIDEQPPSGGGITEAEVQDLIDQYQPVTGGVGQAIGIPPGVPFAYVPPNLVNYPIDSLALFELNADDYAITGGSGSRVGFQQRECVFSQDTSDVFGQGTDALLTYVESTDSLVAFSPSSGTVSSVSVNSTTNSSLLNGFFTTNGSLVANVSHSGTNSGNIPTYVYDGTTMTSITLTAPTSPSAHRCVATGPDETNTYITALWAVNGTNAAQLVIRTYDLTGTQVASRTETVPTNTNLQAACGIIDEGYIMFSVPRTTNNGVVYMREASTATQAWTAFNTQVQIPQPSMSVGSTGVAWIALNYNNDNALGSRIDLLKLTFSTGVTTTYADALTGLIDPFIVANTTVRGSSTGIAYIDDDNVAVTGRLITGASSPFDHTPIYCQATTATGGTISITQTSFPDFTSSLALGSGSTSNYPTACFSPICLADTSAAFIIHQASTIGVSPTEQWIENVAT